MYLPLMKGGVKALRSTAKDDGVWIVRPFRAHPSGLFQMRDFVRQQAAVSHLPDRQADHLGLEVSNVCAQIVRDAEGEWIFLAWHEDARGVEVRVRADGLVHRRLRVSREAHRAAV
jgi:hypothetical protein